MRAGTLLTNSETRNPIFLFHFGNMRSTLKPNPTQILGQAIYTNVMFLDD